MGQNIEIEFKNLLQKDEFERISEHFGLLEDSFKKQVNHYFDTQEFSLKDKGSALRIREKGGQSILTLKQPHEEGLLETDQLLSQKEAEAVLEEGALPAGRVAVEIGKLGVNVSDLSYFGTLATTRAELPYQNGLLVLDHSTYLDTEDYELEYEAAEYSEGKQTFETLLHQLGIPERQTPNKIRRFYTRKQELK
ncbi:CYTH domain-containing protein [Bacillus sp. B-jedd]|uniref:CYTH domain-containing protein n=1 Tax=Bacillus sp. B-jedd TaxID=1476857 RepID=UPI0005155443|nr:CYTH domain-containing protein [Bacillus sp. B-jedd]CEG26119.1 RNA/thiamine triphosphatase [Bacillus sp. B-jedd]